MIGVIVIVIAFGSLVGVINHWLDGGQNFKPYVLVMMACCVFPSFFEQALDIGTPTDTRVVGLYGNGGVRTVASSGVVLCVARLSPCVHLPERVLMRSSVNVKRPNGNPMTIRYEVAVQVASPLKFLGGVGVTEPSGFLKFVVYSEDQRAVIVEEVERVLYDLNEEQGRDLSRMYNPRDGSQAEDFADLLERRCERLLQDDGLLVELVGWTVE